MIYLDISLGFSQNFRHLYYSNCRQATTQNKRLRPTSPAIAQLRITLLRTLNKTQCIIKEVSTKTDFKKSAPTA